MRTVLYGIHLLIDNMKLLDRVFISKQDCAEESRIAKRQRERESESERGSELRKRRDVIGRKKSR